MFEEAEPVPATGYPMDKPTLPVKNVASDTASLTAPSVSVKVMPCAWHPSVKNPPGTGFERA